MGLRNDVLCNNEIATFFFAMTKVLFNPFPNDKF